MSFLDHFSRQSSLYAAHRPRYPAELFAWLASLVTEHRRAWDCATGNGQAAVDLATYFEMVLASDASLAQIRNRQPHARVEYLVATAERAPFADGCCDLVTVAQAVHWFDFERFYAEVRRVVRPGGVVALWTYASFQVSDEIDPVVGRFYEEVVGPYWPPQRAYVEAAYRTIPFAFAEIEAPPFECVAYLDLEGLVGYLRSWSAVQRFRDVHGEDPVLALRPELAAAWGAGDKARRVSWKLHLRAGRI
jgi:ubiquinone/menaquinone biosynthesis C-methylase UbiE